MICERCHYVFRAEDGALTLFDRKCIREHLRIADPCVVCSRCGHMQHLEFPRHCAASYWIARKLPSVSAL